MKKLIALILAMLMCLAGLSACTAVDEPGTETTTDAPETGTAAPETDASETETEAPETDTTASETEAPETDTTAPETEPETTPATPDVEYDLEAAAEYVNSLYKKGETITAADYQVVGQVMIAGVKYMVTWTADNDKVKLVEGNPYWTVDVDEKAKEEHSYKLTATITAGDGNTTTVSFDRTVPEYVLWSFEEYINAPEGTTVVIEGIVVAMNSKSLGNTRNHLFLADVEGKGGYYCYQLDTDPVEAGVKVGMTVSVTAVTAPYSGMQETKGGTFTIVDETIKTVEPMDLTDKFIAGESLKNYVGLPVVIKGVTIGTQELATATSQYLFFELNGQKAYVRSYVTDFPTSLQIIKGENGAISSPDKDAMDADHAAHFGYTADATGILILYSGAPYLIPMSVTPFTNYQFTEKTAAEKIEAEKDALSVVDKITENTTLDLPTVGQFYEDVTIAWTVDNDSFTIGADGKLSVTLGKEQVTLTLTATISCGDDTDTATFTVKVDAADSSVYVTKPVTTPVADTAYKFFLVQGTLGKTLYVTGEVSGRYLVTTDKVDQAADVYVETVEGGVKFYILVEGEKQYITVYNNAEGKLSVNFDAAGTSVYVYNAEVNAWVTNMDGTDYYLGTYSTYNTVSASKLSYINADNTGVSQFPAGVATLAPATIVSVPNTTPVADTAYKFFLVQGSLGKTLYITGEVNGRYLVTTDKIDQAADVYVETVDGGVKFYILVEGEKQYITVYNNAEGKLSVKFDAAGTSVYAYNAEVNAWVTNMDGTDYYLGTYSTYNTVSASKLSYINADNTGVSQFPAGVASLEIVEVVFKPATTPVADTAYKFFLVQGSLGKTLYVTGEVNGRYLVTTDKIDQAADVYVEIVDGGVKFYILVEGEKQYITVYNNAEGKLSVKFDAAGTSVYVYNAEVNAWVTNMDGTDYYLGTYSTYNTVSASKLSYINADNTGVSQFPAGVGSFVIVEDEDVETPDEPETPEEPEEPAKEMTIPEANAAADDTKVIVTGTVMEINSAWSEQYKNINVTIYDADGNKLYLYRLSTKVNLGDVITVTGEMDTYGGSRQIAAGATAEIISAHTCTDFTDATCTAPKTCTVCGATEGNALDHTYVDGTCTGCGVIEPSGDQTTLSSTIADIATANGWADSILYESFNLNSDITVSSAGTPVGSYGRNTGKYYVSNSTWRIYQNEAPSLTISAAEGKTIVSVKVTYSVKNGGVLTQGDAQIESGAVVTVNANSVTFSVGNTGTNTKGNVQITAIEVIYQ